MVSQLAAQLDQLRHVDAERSKLRERRDLCTPFSVFGSDSGQRDSLNLTGSSFQNIRVKMPVLYANGVVGLISRCGAAGASVRLITDPGFVVSASFRSFETTDDGQTRFATIHLPVTVFEGMGKGVMLSRMLSRKDVEESKLKVGDVVVVEDTDWPDAAQGAVLGRVTSILPRRDAPMLAEIKAVPLGNLMQLREVMVMNK
jgi:cell shape-determining protein MreC